MRTQGKPFLIAGKIDENCFGFFNKKELVAVVKCAGPGLPDSANLFLNVYKNPVKIAIDSVFEFFTKKQRTGNKKKMYKCECRKFR